MMVIIKSLKWIFIVGLLLCSGLSLAAGLSWPIDCLPGDNRCSSTIGFPDTDNNGVAHDCGSPGYIGHQGTDISVFQSAVAAGVNVMAADDGEILFVFDGHDDDCPSSASDCQAPPSGWFEAGQSNGYRRCTNVGAYCPDGSYGCFWCFDGGNVVVMKHPSNGDVFATRYDHLKKNSITVQVGDTVTRGDKLAEAASAGASTGPHLHFEVWGTTFYDLVDPWAGQCGPNIDQPLWENDPPWSSCNGLAVTVNLEQGQSPTSGDDVILGTDGDDLIVALGGNDTICGLGGNDTINAGAGDDWVDAGDGDDTVFGLTGADVIYGGSGADEIISGNEDDLVYGDEGNDTLNSGLGDDVVYGGVGADSIFAQGGDDLVYAGDGNDFVIGVDGADELHGGQGDDILNGGPGNDEVFGDGGADKIYGLSGDDILDAGDGSDFVFGQIGFDTIIGGKGDDKLWGNEADDVISDISGDNVINGGAGNDMITGGSGNDTIYGDGNFQHAGDDFIDGGDGVDLLVGFSGADTIVATDGEVDTINGGPGADVCTTDVIDTVYNCP